MIDRLNEELAQVVVPPGFQERCRRTAGLALAIVRMRQAEEKYRPNVEGFPAWIAGLASTAQVELRPVLDWLGAGSLSPVEAGAGAAYAKLGDALGLSRARTRLMALAGLAEAWGYVLEPARLPRRGGADDSAEEMETALDSIAAELDPSRTGVWERLLRDIATAPRTDDL